MHARGGKRMSNNRNLAWDHAVLDRRKKRVMQRW
jgi:hypothetical protein